MYFSIKVGFYIPGLFYIKHLISDIAEETIFYLYKGRRTTEYQTGGAGN